MSAGLTPLGLMQACRLISKGCSWPLAGERRETVLRVLGSIVRGETDVPRVEAERTAAVVAVYYGLTSHELAALHRRAA